MNSLSVASLLLVAVFAISTEAAFPKRTLLQQDPCPPACDAVRRTDPNTLRAIINAGNRVCNCICNTANGERLLHIAVRSRCGECIRILVFVAFCQSFARDRFRNTAMHTMASLCQLGIDETLIELRFAVFARNNDRNTPLCVASRANNPDCGQVSRMLIGARANVFSRCSDGLTPCTGCVHPNVCSVISQDTGLACPGP